MWNVADGRTLRTLSGHDDSVLVAVWQQRRPLAATAAAKQPDCGVTGELVHTLKGHTAALDDAVFSPTGEFVVTASTDKTARSGVCKMGGCSHPQRARG